RTNTLEESFPTEAFFCKGSGQVLNQQTERREADREAGRQDAGRPEERQEELSELLRVRRDKLDQLRRMGIDPFGRRFERNARAADILKAYGHLPNEELEARPADVSLAGRIMQKRSMGKASFAHIQDLTGRIQIYVRKDEVGDDAYALFDLLD